MPAPTPYIIGGNLNFGNPGSSYQSAYANALRINSTNYSNILKGYQGLTKSVLGNIAGTQQSALQDVTDQYAKLAGQASSSLVSRGLGNTTVADSIQRGIGYDRAKANTGVQNQFAQTYAGYQTQLGQGQLNWMNSVQAPYPNPAAYIQPRYPTLPQSAPLQNPNLGGFNGGYSRAPATVNPYQAASASYPMGAYSPYVTPPRSTVQTVDFGYGDMRTGTGGMSFQDAWAAEGQAQSLYDFGYPVPAASPYHQGGAPDYVGGVNYNLANEDLPYGGTYG